MRMRCRRFADFKVHPQAFMAAVAREISSALHNRILEDIKYKKIGGTCWEQSRIEQEAEEGIVRYLSNRRDGEGEVCQVPGETRLRSRT